MPQTQANRVQKNHPKPPRLRSACNQCNTVKLKCSGERDGCIRCRTLRTECIYTESRVGKVQGSRKRKRTQEPKSQTVATSTTATDDQNTSTITPTLQPWAEPWTSEAAWSNYMLNLDNHLNFENILEESTVASPRNTSSASDSTNSSAQTAEHARSISFSLGISNDLPPFIPDHRTDHAGQQNHQESISIPSPTEMTLDARGSLLTPTSQVDSTYSRMASARENSVLETPRRDFSKLDSRCVIACTQILVTLENYLLSELRALDLILATVSKAVDDLKKIVELQQESRCDRCIILFTTIMLQVIALLEAGCNSATDHEPDIVDDILSGAQPRLGPSLYFGAFLPTSEEQRSWRSRIITREYRHVGEILSSVLVLARLGSRGSSTDPIAVASRLGCLGNIEQRLKEMAAKEAGADI